MGFINQFITRGHHIGLVDDHGGSAMVIFIIILQKKMFQLLADIAHLSKTGADMGVINEIMKFLLRAMKNNDSVIKTYQNERNCN